MRDLDDYSAEFPFPPSGEGRAVPVAAPVLLGSGPAGSLPEAIPAFFSTLSSVTLRRANGLPVQIAAGSTVLPLSPSVGAILLIAATHDRVQPGDLVARLVCQHAERIGLPGLLNELPAVPAFARAEVGRVRRE